MTQFPRYTGNYRLDYSFEDYAGNLNFIVKDIYSLPENPFESRYGFSRYESSIHAVNISDSSSTPIDYLYDLEFVQWPSEENYDENSPAIYQIEGYIGESIEVYSSARFQYQIRSTKNFSNLF